jgi:hypothetical protein
MPFVMIDRAKYKAELELAEARLSRLLATKRHTENEIARLRLDISALAQLCGEPVMTTGRLGLESLGLADACREVLRANVGVVLAPTDVIEGLKTLGFPVEGHSNITASVATTLRRMVRSGELEFKRTPDGRAGFRLNDV